MDKSNGFSLIETIVVLSLITLLTGISLGGYSTFAGKKKLESETNRVAKTLELARQRMISGDKIGIANPGLCTLSAYKITYSGANFNLLAVCAVDIPIAQYSLESGYQISGNAGPVIFKPDGLIDSPVCIIISTPSVQKCREIRVSLSGVIETSDEKNLCTC